MSMGGYGLFVWGSYAVVLGGLLLLTIRSFKRAKLIREQCRRISK